MRRGTGGILPRHRRSITGGWYFEMWVGPHRARGAHVWPGKATWPDPGPEHGTDTATFDDGNTFGSFVFVSNVHALAAALRAERGEK